MDCHSISSIPELSDKDEKRYLFGAWRVLKYHSVLFIHIITYKTRLTHWLKPGGILTAPLSSVKKKLALSPWSEVTFLRGSASCNNTNERNWIMIKNFIFYSLLPPPKRQVCDKKVTRFYIRATLYLKNLIINKIVRRISLPRLILECII